MTGTTVITNDQHARWPGGERRTFARDEIVAFGRHANYGSFVIRYQVRLLDGTEVMLVASEQDKADAAWLRALARRTPSPRTSRECPQADTWIVVSP
jgi:hypothetical protein